MGKSDGVDCREEGESEDKGEGVTVSDSSPFNSWLGECFTNRISLESPRDACVLASFSKTLESGANSDIVWKIFLLLASFLKTLESGANSDIVWKTLTSFSKTLESAANSDIVWEKFLPQDYKSLVPRWREFLSKKELYLALCDDPVLIDNAKKRLWLEKASGKRCIMLPAMDLYITWGDDLRYWRWVLIPDEARFGKIAELIKVCWFEIRGRINTRFLSPATCYSAYIVFKKGDNCYGFKDTPAEAVIEEVGKEHSRRFVYFDEATDEWNIVKPEEREDGWMEVELGEFFTEEVLQSHEIEISVLEGKALNCKRDLVIRGIEIRPSKLHYGNAESKADSEVLKEIEMDVKRVLQATLLGKDGGAINSNVVDVSKMLERIPAEQTYNTVDKSITCGAKPVRSSSSDAKTNADLLDSKITPSQIQVFVSFRGNQLRSNFVGYLVHALQRGKVNVYIDSHEQRGKDLNTLFKRIEGSGIAIVVFSTRYTESRWCLEELVRIKERVNLGLLEVLPIFYNVSPTDVKRLKGEFGDHFRDKEHRYGSDSPLIKGWKEAIQFVSHMFALSFDEKSGVLESDFVETIVKEVLKILQSVPIG